MNLLYSFVYPKLILMSEYVKDKSKLYGSAQRYEKMVHSNFVAIYWLEDPVKCKVCSTSLQSHRTGL